jgi:hypothetical protein
MEEREQQNDDDDNQQSDHAHAIVPEATLLQHNVGFVDAEVGVHEIILRREKTRRRIESTGNRKTCGRPKNYGRSKTGAGRKTVQIETWANRKATADRQTGGAVLALILG